MIIINRKISLKKFLVWAIVLGGFIIIPSTKIAEAENKYEKTVEDYNQQITNLKLCNQQLNKKIVEQDNLIIELENEIQTSKSSDIRTYLGKFELTYYCISGTTATGNPTMEELTVAVDPNVIPLNSKLYIDGLGVRVAHDTGGVIKGNIIDVYVPDYDTCIQLGRTKNVDVWLIN